MIVDHETVLTLGRQSWEKIMEQVHPAILVVDDQAMVRKIIGKYLSDLDYHIVEASTGEAALEALCQPYADFDVVLLDRTMPGMDGIELLRRMKLDKRFADIPVIFQTSRDSESEIEEGIRAGAHFYLTKPFDEVTLRSVVGTAIEKQFFYREMKSAASLTTTMMRLLKNGTFQFQTLEQGRLLASTLAAGTPEPERVVTGLSELFINAVEHGNLAINYDEKTALQESGDWLGEIEKRLTMSEYADRFATVEVKTLEDRVVWRITDEGAGFDWQKYLELDAERAFDSHGRGIMMSKVMSFDQLHYEGAGNIAIAEIFTDPEAMSTLGQIESAQVTEV